MILLFLQKTHFPFYLILNGVKQNDKPETNVKIVGLNIDRANLKVVFENNSIASFLKMYGYQELKARYTII